MRMVVGIMFWLAALTLHAFAWGPEGHVVIAIIAEERLSLEVKQTVRKMLSGAPLATAGIFADEYRVTHPEISRWHYVDIPFEETAYNEKRDCQVLVTGDCVIHAIERAEAMVKDPDTKFYDRADALKYLDILSAICISPSTRSSERERMARVTRAATWSTSLSLEITPTCMPSGIRASFCILDEPPRTMRNISRPIILRR